MAATPPPLERLLRVAATAGVGVIGSVIAVLLAGRLTFTVDALDVELFARPGAGVTDIALPPLGRVLADTHDLPLHLTATLQAVDPDRATRSIENGGFPAFAMEVEREGIDALRGYALRALGISAVGAAAASLLVFRRRWRRAAAATAAGILVSVGVAGLTWATYSPAAFLEPTYTGSLRLAPGLVGPVREATHRIEDFRVELERLLQRTVQAYAGLAAQPSPSPEAVAVLHISDVHASPLGMDLAQQLAEAFDVDVVLDTGDITSFGTPVERTILDRIRGFDVPYVFVRGNHDSIEVGRRIDALPGTEVLEGEALDVAGLRIYGAPHPLYTPNPDVDLDDEGIRRALMDAGLRLAERLAADPEPPDLLAVHDDRMALPSVGLVPLVASGHFHRFGATVNDGSVLLRTASAGGGGLDAFVAEEPFPLSAEILYFEGTPPGLVAFDRVTLDPESRDLVVDRTLASSLPELEPRPAPSPTGD